MARYWPVRVPTAGFTSGKCSFPENGCISFNRSPGIQPVGNISEDSVPTKQVCRPHALSGITLTYWLGINDITISHDSLYIATASDDHTSDIHLLHPPPGVTFYPPPLEPSDASDTEDRPVAPVPPQSSVSSSSSTVPAIRHLVSHTAPVLSVAFSPKSNLLATGSFDESTIIWDVRRGKVLRQLPAHADAVWCVAWDVEGEMVLTAGADGLM